MMERRAKERLIGASILVVLIVLVVPELLSGPKPTAPAPQPQRLPAAASAPEPIRNVTVDLATSKAPTTAETDSAPAPAASEATLQPASAATAPSPEPESEAPATAPAAAPAPPVGGPPLESQGSSPISKTGSARGEVSRSPSWSVQLGSFASRANADNLVRRLKAQGFAAYILSGGSGAATRHRVRVGPLADRGAAERSAAKLKTLGHSSSLVAPGA
jgi:DedD protein